MKNLVASLLCWAFVFPAWALPNAMHTSNVGWNGTTRSGGGGVTTATDTFNRADADPISNPMSDGVSTWTSSPGSTGDVKIVSNAATRSSGTYGVASVATPAFGDDQEAQVTLTAAGVDSTGVLVRVASSSDASCYLLYVASATNMVIYKMTDTGSLGFSSLKSITVTTLVAGNKIKLTAVGTTISAYIDTGSGFVFQDSTTDPSFASGQPGIMVAAGVRDVDGFIASNL